MNSILLRCCTLGFGLLVLIFPSPAQPLLADSTASETASQRCRCKRQDELWATKKSAASNAWCDLGRELVPVGALQSSRNRKLTAGFLLSTAGLVALDPHDAPHFRRTTTFNGFNKVMGETATQVGIVAFPAVFYGAARLAHSRKKSNSLGGGISGENCPSVSSNTYALHTSFLAWEAAVDGFVVSEAMKAIDRRLRPREIAPDGDFTHTWFKAGLGHGSFPSGHTITAFSVATVFAERYAHRTRHPWVPWAVSYGLASTVAFSRVTRSAHFPSDVFAGAFLGWALSDHVVLACDTGKSNLFLRKVWHCRN